MRKPPSAIDDMRDPAREGSRQAEPRLPAPRLLEERIDHRQVAEPPAVLEVLAVERLAAGLDGGGEDPRGLDGALLGARARDRGGVGF